MCYFILWFYGQLGCQVDEKKAELLKKCVNNTYLSKTWPFILKSKNKCYAISDAVTVFISRVILDHTWVRFVNKTNLASPLGLAYSTSKHCRRIGGEGVTCSINWFNNTHPYQQLYVSCCSTKRVRKLITHKFNAPHLRCITEQTQKNIWLFDFDPKKLLSPVVAV